MRSHTGETHFTLVLAVVVVVARGGHRIDLAAVTAVAFSAAIPVRPVPAGSTASPTAPTFIAVGTRAAVSSAFAILEFPGPNNHNSINCFG